MKLESEFLGLSFDDVLLIPNLSTFSSRFSGEIDISTSLSANNALDLKYPIISANMDSVSEIQMVNALNGLGATGIIHRAMSPETQALQLSKVTNGPIIACIGVGAVGMLRLRTIIDMCPRVDAILIDVAHGHSVGVINQIVEIKKNYGDNYCIIAGNIVTPQAARALMSAGADCLKVGVGPGSVCTTRVQTGCGVPQITAINWVCSAVGKFMADNPKRKVTVIADGGVKNSGDVVKALASGADAVMLGSMFAGCDETPGEVLEMPNDKKFKLYRGMASKQAQEDWKGLATSVEGVSRLVPYRGPVENVLAPLVKNVQSGMSYVGAKNLEELRNNAVFIRQTSSGYRESSPHGLLG